MRRFLAVSLCAALVLPGPASAASRALAPTTGVTIPVVGLRATAPLTAPALPGLTLPASIAALPKLQVAPAAAAPVAAQALVAAQAPAVAARAQLARVQQALAVPEGAPAPASPAAARELSESVWSGASPSASPAAEVSGAESSSTSLLKKPSRALLAAGVAVPSPAYAASLTASAAWLTPVWAAVAPYVEGAAILGVTYAAHRLVRLVVQKLAKRGKWEPNTADTVRFISTMATWALGATVGFHLSGASATALLTGFGLAMTLAVKKTIGNLLQGVQFLVNRPFVIGDKVRVGDNLHEVADMELQYVTMRTIGKLVLEKPAVVPDGVEYLPFKDVDPLGRESDDKGYRWVMVRKTSPGPRTESGVRHESKIKYSVLAGVAITLYREHRPVQQLAKPRAALRGLMSALKEAPRGALLKAVLWMAGSIALIPLLPLAQGLIAWEFAAVLFPYVHGLASIWATRQVARFFERLTPIVGKKLGWSHQATVVVKLLVQVGVYAIGLSAGMRALGLAWGTVATSLGATAAAMSFASSDILGNLAQALMLRFDRPFNIGDTLRVGADVGVVQEMNMFHVVLKVADGSHTLVPYSVIDATALETFQTESKQE